MYEETFRAKWGSDEELDRDYQEKQRESRECDEAERALDEALYQDALRAEAAQRSRDLTREIINIATHHYLLARIEATGTE